MVGIQSPRMGSLGPANFPIVRCFSSLKCSVHGDLESALFHGIRINERIERRRKGPFPENPT